MMLNLTVNGKPSVVYGAGAGQVYGAGAGNLCRCTGYQKIISAVHVAARNSSGRHGPSHEEVEEHNHAIPE